MITLKIEPALGKISHNAVLLSCFKQAREHAES